MPLEFHALVFLNARAVLYKHREEHGRDADGIQDQRKGARRLHGLLHTTRLGVTE